MKESKRFELNSLDWKSIGKGALKVMIGALLTYVTDLLPGIEFGQYTPAVMWIYSAGTNVVWK